MGGANNRLRNWPTVNMVSNLLSLGVALLCGLFTMLVQGYMSVFLMDFRALAPVTVDHSPEWHNPPRLEAYPALNNALLLLLFVLQHTYIPRTQLHKVLRLFPEVYYRPLYILATTIVFCIIMWFWLPMPTVVWEVTHQQLWYGLMGLNLLLWLGVVLSLSALDVVHFMGVDVPLQKLGWRQLSSTDLVETGPYGLVRHPVYSCLLSAFFLVPKMTQGHLLFAVVLSLYTVLAVIYYEEPDLVKHMGPAYKRYMEKIPRFVPLPWLYGVPVMKKT